MCNCTVACETIWSDNTTISGLHKGILKHSSFSHFPLHSQNKVRISLKLAAGGHDLETGMDAEELNELIKATVGALMLPYSVGFSRYFVMFLSWYWYCKNSTETAKSQYFARAFICTMFSPPPPPPPLPSSWGLFFVSVVCFYEMLV